MHIGKVYLVGGAVRDHLLGIESRDRDYVVVGSTPEKMLAAGFSQVGASFPVFLHPETGEEYALARTERKTGFGYHGFETFYDPTVTLEDDLARRDLTINSMAMDEDGKIIDPFNGQRDLKNRVLRHTSQAFSEDPLRVLRLARFAARYVFSVAQETQYLARQIVTAGELNHLPRERIWTELLKGFNESDPSLMLCVLREVGALEIRPLNGYFGGDFNVGLATVYFKLSAEILSSPTMLAALGTVAPSNVAEINAVHSMKALSKLDDAQVLELRVPNHVRDAVRLEKKLSALLLSDHLIADRVHEFLTSTRFVQGINQEVLTLAMFASAINAMLKIKIDLWKKNLTRVNRAAEAVRGLDMASIVNKGDTKTVKFRVDAAKFFAVKGAI
jgi:hypothetical protein